MIGFGAGFPGWAFLGAGVASSTPAVGSTALTPAAVPPPPPPPHPLSATSISRARTSAVPCHRPPRPRLPPRRRPRAAASTAPAERDEHQQGRTDRVTWHAALLLHRPT